MGSLHWRWCTLFTSTIEAVESQGNFKACGDARFSVEHVHTCVQALWPMLSCGGDPS